jgi:hypothetical protein
MGGQDGAPSVGSILLALLLCGLLGVLGQGIRAVVGLKNLGALTGVVNGGLEVVEVGDGIEQGLSGCTTFPRRRN